jgi:hypothetical protein
MHLRTLLPLLLSVAGIFVILPIIGNSTKTNDTSRHGMPSGTNTFSYLLNEKSIIGNTHLVAEVVHEPDLFYLTLWLGEDLQDRITFVLKEEEITTKAYVLDDPERRYASFELQTANCTYTADEFFSGLLMIHSYDRERHLIAGSFELMAFSDGCQEIIRLREGMFDARLGK